MPLLCHSSDLSRFRESFQNLISLLTPVPPSLPKAWRQRVLSTAPERGVSVPQVTRSTTEMFFSRKPFSQVVRRIPSKTLDRKIATTKVALVQESEFLHLVQERQVQIWEAEETRLGPMILLGSSIGCLRCFQTYLVRRCETENQVVCLDF